MERTSFNICPSLCLTMHILICIWHLHWYLHCHSWDENSIISTFMWSVPFSESQKFSKTPVPNLFDIRDDFHGRHFSMDGLEMIQAHTTLVYFYFYYYFTMHLRSSVIKPQSLGTPALKLSFLIWGIGTMVSQRTVGWLKDISNC